MKYLSSLFLLLLPFFSKGQIITTCAGNGLLGYTGDGGLATAARLNGSISVAVDDLGNIYIPDLNNNVIRKVDPAGIIHTIAGTGVPGYSGDGGPASVAALSRPWNVAVDNSGNMYIAEQGNNVIRKVNTAGIITTFAGTGVIGYTGDGGPATNARFNLPWGIAISSSGEVIIADGGNDVVRKVDAAGIVTTIAGVMGGGFGGDGGPASTAMLNNPIGLAFDRIGNLYIGDNQNNRIRMIVPSGTISTIAGTGFAGYFGDGGPATVARINNPMGVSTDTSGNIYVADFLNHVIRKITGTTIITIGGNGIAGYSGDGGPATAAQLSQPWGIGVNKQFYVYIGDNNNDRIRLISPCGGIISGGTAVCVGNNITLSNTVTGGTWSSNNAAIATIGSGSCVVSGVSPGIVIISYSQSGSCFATTTVSVSPLPGTITGIASVCAGSSIALSNPVSGGTWSSASPGVASVGSVSGVVTGVTPGSAIITYSMPGDCFITTTVTVVAGPSAITGNTAICVGSSTTLSNTVGGGTWTSGSAGIAAVGLSSGVVTGIAAGTAVITYAIGTGCFVTTTITLSALPAPITGSMLVCAGASITLSDAVSGGTWSSGSLGVATVGIVSGIVTGVAGGSATITYTMPGGCFITTTITVDPAPAIITGNIPVCAGSVIKLSDATAGGTWSSGSPGIAAVGPLTGIVTGVAAGVATITYTIGSGCFVITTVSVIAMPGPISGIMPVCTGSVIKLSDAVSGGVWSSDATTIAVVGAGIGVVTGITAGTTVITYSISGCLVTGTIVVRTTPVAILGNAQSICEDKPVILGSPEPPGVTYQWSTGSTDSSISVSDSGLYTLIVTLNGCTDTASVRISLLPPPLPIFLGPDTAICIDEEVTLHSRYNSSVWSNNHVGENITVKTEGKYWAVITNACGSSSDTINVDVITCYIVFPTGFTPNGDGLNDVFKAIIGNHSFSNYLMNIYNRWGNLVFTTGDIHKGWDGKKNGIPQDMNTYYYMIKYTFRGEQHLMKGDFQLIR